jgi:hypothetical protein
MMGRRRRDQGKLFFISMTAFPKNHLLRRIDVFVTATLNDLHKELDPYYSEIGRPSVDPELMIRAPERERRPRERVDDGADSVACGRCLG